MDRALENMQNAGLIFMFSVWLQGQMADLIILKNHPHLVPEFIAKPERVPHEFGQLRAKYWEKQFGDVRAEFLAVFAKDVTAGEAADLEHVYHVRNMIGHAHVSIGRDYMLYRPAGEKKEKAIVSALNLKPVDDQMQPMMVVLRFWQEDIFKNISDTIGRLDQSCFARLATSISIPHGRIR
ncbi:MULTISPECIES: hypothetical protein [Xanthomonas]|uniref:hypothetical protein n=1 Tax=Xanthomonas TaxID=338 RepID=UPI0011600B03|nr:hypothetical protein [Xanthomonas euvesicatoria]MBV6787526.1 hypothetical protein [Xanthomonas campestris pv. uppalii]MCP3045508.1 hypothetical protein [Xanthomonas euvesicatoria pv. allii]